MSVETVGGVHMLQCPHDGNGCTGHKQHNDCWHMHPERRFHVNDCEKRQRSIRLHPERYKDKQASGLLGGAR